MKILYTVETISHNGVYPPYNRMDSHEPNLPLNIIWTDQNGFSLPRGLVKELEEAYQKRLSDEQPEVVIKMTKDEARKVLHIMSRTMARNNCTGIDNILDTGDKIEADIRKQLG